MKNITRLILSAVFCFAAVGCIEDPKEFSYYTKAEIRQGLGDDGVDYCDENDWLGDGVCDDFCDSPDPDCDATCLAYPSCGPDRTEVDECPPGSTCEDISMCGSTITCLDDSIAHCEAYPSCGDRRVL